MPRPTGALKRGREICATAGDGLQRLFQDGNRVLPFIHEAMNVCLLDPEYSVVVAVRREHQSLGETSAGAEPLDHGDAVHVGQGKVEHEDVRLFAENQVNRLTARLGLSHH